MKIGNKVVCINNKPLLNKGNRDLHLLKEGEIYNVINIIDCGIYGVGIVLKEIQSTNPVGFDSSRFREVDENFGEKITKNIESQLMEEELYI